jgi:hypothetical protein
LGAPYDDEFVGCLVDILFILLVSCAVLAMIVGQW